MSFKTYNEDTKYKDGVYISVDITEKSKELLNAYMKANLKGIQKNKTLHSTIIYSQKELNSDVDVEEYTTKGLFKRFERFGPDKEVLVIELICDKLVERNKELVEKYDFVSDFNSYKPHLTLAYNIDKDFDLSKLPEIDFTIEFHNETAEPLKLDWKSEVKEEV